MSDIPGIDPEFRQAVLDLCCPICGKGPFKMLASHTSQKHDLSAWELRDRAGLRLYDSISSDDLRAQRTAQGHKNVETFGPPPGMPKGGTLRRTRAGNHVQRLKIEAILADEGTNERRREGISRALKTKAESDPEHLAKLQKLARQARKANRKRHSCVVCGRKFWRTPQTSDRSTCSDVCWHAALRKGLRIGWVRHGYKPNSQDPENAPS